MGKKLKDTRPVTLRFYKFWDRRLLNLQALLGKRVTLQEIFERGFEHELRRRELEAAERGE